MKSAGTMRGLDGMVYQLNNISSYHIAEHMKFYRSNNTILFE